MLLNAIYANTHDCGDGHQVHMIERDLREPDRIAGEILQPGGYLKLLELGLEDCVNDIDAQLILGYSLFKDGKSIKLPYPLEDFHTDVAGRSFQNGRFVQKLREKAASLSNVRLEQGTVKSLLEENGIVKGVKYKIKPGDHQELTAYAPLTIICDGSFSKLRRFLCNSEVDVLSSFVGWVMEDCPLPYANHVHVVIADPSVIFFYPITSTQVRCFVDVLAKKVPSISNGEMAHYLNTVVAPQIPSELYNAFISTTNNGNKRIVQTRSMTATACSTPGALLMGDALSSRHPFTGGGMTVALSDVVVLRDLLRPLSNLNDPSTLCKYLESFYTLRKPMAFTIDSMASALYKVFCTAPDEPRKELRQICFDYLSLGGSRARQPMSLLAGLKPSFSGLVNHFIAVIIFTIGRLFLPFPLPRRMLIHMVIASRLISNAWSDIFPYFKG